MHNPAPVLENDTHKLLWDFDIQTDHLIPARRPDLIIINKKKEKLQNCRFYCPGGPQNKSEGMWKEGYVPRPCYRIEKAVERESNDWANCHCLFWHNNWRIIKRPGRLVSWRTGREYPNDSIAKNVQNPETSPGDLGRLAVTQTPVKNHQLKLLWKTLIFAEYPIN